MIGRNAFDAAVGVQSSKRIRKHFGLAKANDVWETFHMKIFSRFFFLFFLLRGIFQPTCTNMLSLFAEVRISKYVLRWYWSWTSWSVLISPGQVPVKTSLKLPHAVSNNSTWCPAFVQWPPASIVVVASAMAHSPLLARITFQHFRLATQGPINTFKRVTPPSSVQAEEGWVGHAVLTWPRAGKQ